ncbi:MAG: hypothetical protein OEV92_02875 [Nitrospinota bacterium]|nr:hypothetical protein [Nitrospinota bacterium]
MSSLEPERPWEKKAFKYFLIFAKIQVALIGFNMTVILLHLLSSFIFSAMGLHFHKNSGFARVVAQFPPMDQKIELPEAGEYAIFGDADTWKKCSLANTKLEGPTPLVISGMSDWPSIGKRQFGLGQVAGVYSVAGKGIYFVNCAIQPGEAHATFTMVVKPKTGELAELDEPLGPVKLVISLFLLALPVIIVILSIRAVWRHVKTGGM